MGNVTPLRAALVRVLARVAWTAALARVALVAWTAVGSLARAVAPTSSAEASAMG